MDWKPGFCKSADFIGPNEKKFEKSASKNKHPIKLCFLIWRLQSANPEKKVIPENQGFGSCSLKIFIFHFPSNFEVWYLCEFLNYDNDQIMKKHLFLLKNMILIFLLARAHSSARCAPRYILQKCEFWQLFRVHDAVRALGARASARAPMDTE